ncbi:hypothetical protein LCGC14_0677110 [marine sediment metagenome]|uniref:Uncharacterized protein n=1 Tax=marine sediment metagenome TaxID=412755 RepID=A0A0F9R9G0_9ZZZZ
MSDYLCYYQLHVADKTYFLHCLVEADSVDEAMDKMPETQHHDSHTIQKKGCEGVFDIDKHRKFLKEIGGGIKIE